MKINTIPKEQPMIRLFFLSLEETLRHSGAKYSRKISCYVV